MSTNIPAPVHSLPVPKRVDRFQMFMNQCDVGRMTRIEFVRAFRNATGLGLTDSMVIGSVLYQIAIPEEKE